MSHCDEENLQSLRDTVSTSLPKDRDNAYKKFVEAYLRCQGHPERNIDPEAVKVSTPESLVSLAEEVMNGLGLSIEGIDIENISDPSGGDYDFLPYVP